MEEKILILDFGSQYTQLIARRIRELSIYCEIYPFNRFPVADKNVRGIILSGSPSSVRGENAPSLCLEGLKGKIPILGICYGAQFLVHSHGGSVSPGNTREYGRANLTWIDIKDPLFKGLSPGTQVWMSHGDTIEDLPDGFRVTGSTADIKVAAFRVKGEHTWGIQFHPEVYHTTGGHTVLKNFAVQICRCRQAWTPESFVESTVEDLKSKLGSDKVIMGLSGGVDSTVAASIIHRAIGKNLICIFVDNGLLRKNEYETVLESYRGYGFNVKGIPAGQRFLEALRGVSEPEKKRKIIGRVFIEVFQEEAGKVKDAIWLAQGTIYPDVIESVSVKGPSATIKSHHNVGGLPEKMHLKVIEPLHLLFKDEVRKVGKALGLSENILNRHPFPGPGLAIRLLGEISAEKLELLKEADKIFIDGLIKNGLYDSIWQAGVILLPVQSVGVMGDERTYEYAVVLRAVVSSDGMTADWYHLPYGFLGSVSNEIINKVRGINRVVYDITSKPPSTIEWE